MRKVRTFMDYLLRFDVDEYSEHQRHNYNTIYGKIIYPVALNTIDEDNSKAYYYFNQGNRYEMVR